MTPARRWQLGFAFVLAAHLLALYWPRVDLAGAPQDSDKLAHVLLFGVPTFVGVVGFRRWWPALLLALHAPVSELVQAGWLPGRSGDVRDAMADLVGVAAGSVLALVALRRRPRREGGGDVPVPATPAAHAPAPSTRSPGPEV
ncbi:MAG: VanZ family protein [Dermatophilaceae bacterium]